MMPRAAQKPEIKQHRPSQPTTNAPFQSSATQDMRRACIAQQTSASVTRQAPVHDSGAIRVYSSWDKYRRSVHLVSRQCEPCISRTEPHDASGRTKARYQATQAEPADHERTVSVFSHSGHAPNVHCSSDFGVCDTAGTHPCFRRHMSILQLGHVETVGASRVSSVRPLYSKD